MTRLFGIIGDPISHSFSPVMHAAALRALRCEAIYAPLQAPQRVIRPILRALILAGVEGLNVTVPLKEAVLPLMDRLDPTAQAMGAVNTIVIRHRRTVGYNTDGIGFMRALDELGWRPHPSRAVILGAGGAARAVAWGLARIAGMQLVIANRRVGRAERLARWLIRQHPRVSVQALPLERAPLDEAQLVVNATIVGLRAGERLPLDLKALRRGTLVYDLIYHRETALVRAARRQGCVAANGLSMLLYQGAESLRLWLNRPPPIPVMRRALEQAVSGSRE